MNELAKVKDMFTKTTNLLLSTIIIFSIAFNVKFASDYVVGEFLLETPNIVSIAEATQVPGSTIIKTDPSMVDAQELKCLADNSYYESHNEGFASKLAMANLVMNRVKSTLFPNTVCGVVYESMLVDKVTVCQFKWTCDDKRKSVEVQTYNWRQSREAALIALTSPKFDIVDGSLHFYHTDTLSPPIANFTIISRIDKHVFYKP